MSSIDFVFPTVWTVFGTVERNSPEPYLVGIRELPAELAIADERLTAQTAAFDAENRLNLGALLGGAEEGKTAYALAIVESAKDVEVTFGAGADWWMKWWVNGEVVCDTTEVGNWVVPSPLTRRFTVQLKPGRNLIAVKVVSGGVGFLLAACGPRELRTLDLQREAKRNAMRTRGLSFLFESGRDGYFTCRIPALLATKAGTLLAFCEGRLHSGDDHGSIHLLLRRSEDGGRTWSPAQIVWEDWKNTCGNPCPVQDADTGTIWLSVNWNRAGRHSEEYFGACDTRYVRLLSSDDDGRTWSEPLDITPAVKRPDWGWYAMGPGVGIQIQQGPQRGRLLIPCNHTEFEPLPIRMFSHVIYSDDHGHSWHLGGSSPMGGFDECQVTEISGGRLMLNMRHYGPAPDCRGVAISADGGMTWDAVRRDEALVEPAGGCQGSIIRLPDGRLLFSNPASRKRERLTVRVSSNYGVSWTETAVLHEGPAAYSCLASLPDGRIACLFECGIMHPYETIAFTTLILGEKT
jgi:sialidase-1